MHTSLSTSCWVEVLRGKSVILALHPDSYFQSYKTRLLSLCMGQVSWISNWQQHWVLEVLKVLFKQKYYFIINITKSLVKAGKCCVLYGSNNAPILCNFFPGCFNAHTSTASEGSSLLKLYLQVDWLFALNCRWTDVMLSIKNWVTIMFLRIIKKKNRA